MTYFVRWLQGYGWSVYAARSANAERRIIVSGFSGNLPLEYVLTWCGSTDVTILPAA